MSAVDWPDDDVDRDEGIEEGRRPEVAVAEDDVDKA